MNQNNIPKVLFIILLLAGTVLSAGTVNSQTQKTFKIMPLGDSITLGTSDNNNEGGYRYFLYNNLISNNYSVDFVGSLSSGPNTLPDKAHEGHHGFSIGELSTPVDNWLDMAQPDIILLLAGLNDITREIPNREENISALIDKILARRPDSAVIVSTVPFLPSFPQLNQTINTYNTNLQTIVNTKKSQGKKVALITPVLTPQDTIDGSHPGPTGYQKISDAFYPAIVAIINAPTKLGDTDSDNDVDIRDFNLLVRDFGKQNDPNTKADLDNDDDVDIRDFNIIVTNFGK